VRLGQMFDPVLKLAAGSWRSFRHHVKSARCIYRSTGSGMELHVVIDRELVGHSGNPATRAAYFGAKGTSSDSSVIATRAFAIAIHF
jgi:hypothetical protein